MDGWIESGKYLCSQTFIDVKPTDIVVRSQSIDDGVVICNGESGHKAAMYVTNNRTGICRRPRVFASLDVSGSIFCDTKLELCHSDAQTPITYPRFVVDPHKLYFSDKPNNTPVIIDGDTGTLLTDDVVVRNKLSAIKTFFSIPVRNVTTNNISTNMEIKKETFYKYFYIERYIFIENTTTKIVQFTKVDDNYYNITLVPPLPPHVVSNSIVRVANIQNPIMECKREYLYTKISCITVDIIDDYNIDVVCLGIINDLDTIVDKYVAISNEYVDNYQTIVQIRTVSILQNKTIKVRFASPSLKNNIDLSYFKENQQIYLFMIDDTHKYLRQKEYNIKTSFVIDSNKVGYYLVLENTLLIKMITESYENEHINAIDTIEIAGYIFNVSKTYVKDGKALIYINEQSVPLNIPTMFSGIYEMNYKITGLPLRLNSIKREDSFTITIVCDSIQGFPFGDGMKIICDSDLNNTYLLLNDRSCTAWRIIFTDLANRTLTIRCSDISIVDRVMTDVTPRVVYVVPFKPKDMPSNHYDSIYLRNGDLIFKDINFEHPDKILSYKNDKFCIGDNIFISNEDMLVNGSLTANKYMLKNEYPNDFSTVDSASHLADILSMSIVQSKDEFFIDNLQKDLDIKNLLLKCISSIQELSKKI